MRFDRLLALVLSALGFLAVGGTAALPTGGSDALPAGAASARVALEPAAPPADALGLTPTRASELTANLAALERARHVLASRLSRPLDARDVLTTLQAPTTTPFAAAHLTQNGHPVTHYLHPRKTGV